ncbi:two-component system activity regulator YycH [Neobacillus drentensis]|uniref:YycH family regulatory protein n=1 Tax=Neobacillus drentensis TaxID=220684 RepID=UPI001F3274BE|nr:two-component system activity regulator YycH [Neobacillus drentensis]ULT57062.1 two-component system activity regulator YycH [Neobacillus drentensis]
MRYENIKSGILTVLVLVSLLLTWNLWTYQPNYDKMEKSKTVAEVTVDKKQDVTKIVRPDQVLFHVKGEHYGTSSPDELDKLMKEISSWTISDVKNYTERAGNLDSFIHGSGNAELVFPGDVPIELYLSVLNIEGKKIPPFNFNRIIVNVNELDKGNGSVYFASTETGQIYVSRISTANLNEFNRDYYKNAARYPKFFAYKSSDKRSIYLPEAKVKMTTYKYLPVTLNSDEFKDALFDDPSFVQRSSIPHGEEFTNDSSKMTVNYDSNILQYINPTPEESFVDSSYDLVKRSIDFVNEHGGWTDSFRYVSKSESKRSVTFRLYSTDGYPIFNNNGLSEMTEEWGRDEINKYVRPNITLDLPLLTEMQTVTPPSGHEILAALQSNKNFKPELLEELVLGYQMVRSSDENKLILLEPAWFYRYNKSWGQIMLSNLGGGSVDGLE